MSVANTVEATLRSRYVDGITEGLRRTQQTINTMVSFSVGLFQNFSASIAGGFDSALNASANFGRQLFDQGRQSESVYKGMSLAALGAGFVVVGWFGQMAAAAARWVTNAAIAGSETLELKLIFEGLAKTAGEDSADGIDKLRRATEGLISTQVLLKNANRVLQADIPITLSQYEKLVENVFKLAKASGADAVQAQNMLTDAVVKGNARGFQSIGVNLQIKDAINEMALAQGIATSKVDTDAKLRGFYNELLNKTSDAVKRNGTDYFSFADAVEKSHSTISLWTNAVGEAIGRSGVFAELLRRYSGYLDEAGPRQQFVNEAALGFNRILILVLRALDLFLVTAALLAPLFNTVWQVGWAAFYALRAGIGFVITAAISLLAAIFNVADALAKVAGINWFESTAKQFDGLSKVFGRATISMAEETGRAVKGIFSLESTRTLGGYSNQIAALVKDLEQYKGVVVEGTGGTRGLAEAQAAAAGDMKKLKEELKNFLALMTELGNKLSSPSQQNLNALLADFRKIDEFRHVSEDQIREARLRALAIYRQAEEKLAMERRDKQFQLMTEADQLQSEMDKNQAENAKRLALEYTQLLRVASGEVAREQEALFNAVIDAARKKRQEEQAKAISEAVSTANAIARAVQLSKEGKIDSRIGAEAIGQSQRALAELQRQLTDLQKLPLSNGQVDEVIKLKQAIEDLNNINLTGFERAVKAAGDFVKDFTKGTLNAFSSLMSDLVTGQENAGKKFLGALLGMVADGIMIWAKYLIAVSIAKFALGDFAGGFKAAAGAALVAAAAGVVRGIGANVAGTSQAAGSAGSFQQTTPRPISGTTQQIINVGAPGRGQTVGEGQQGEVHTVRIEVPQGFVTQAVERDIKGNGKLRTIIAQYAPA
jgi:hypothetical protein